VKNPFGGDKREGAGVENYFFNSLLYPARPYLNAIKHRGRLFHTCHKILVLKSQEV
jgi:hypothetical protein